MLHYSGLLDVLPVPLIMYPFSPNTPHYSHLPTLHLNIINTGEVKAAVISYIDGDGESRPVRERRSQ